MYTPTTIFGGQRGVARVRIRRMFPQELRLGIFRHVSVLTICASRMCWKHPFDIVFGWGHYPSAMFFGLLGRSTAKLVTNIDGLCWKRAQSGAGPFVGSFSTAGKTLCVTAMRGADHQPFSCIARGGTSRNRRTTLPMALFPKTAIRACWEGFALPPRGISTWLRAWSQRTTLR